MKSRQLVHRSAKAARCGLRLECWKLHVGRWTLSALLVLAPALPAQDPTPAPSPLAILVRTLGKMENPAVQLNILKGMNASLKGRHNVPAPPGWDELYARLKASSDAEVRQQAQSLAVIFGGGAALEEMRGMLGDATVATGSRQAALESLVAAKDAASLPLFMELLKQSGPLRAPAIRALAAFDDPRIAPALLGGFAGYDSAEKRDALNTLLVRPATARALLAAIDARSIDRTAITAPLARQVQSFKDASIDAWLAKNWGSVRTSSADKQAQIAKMKQFLTTDLILKADANRGRALFAQTCGVCHTLFGIGGKIGPELPGSFEDVDYLLQNIVDPNAIIGKDYQQTFVQLKDGQTVSGIVAGDDPGTVTLRTLGGDLRLQRQDIVEMKVSELSMMPEGLLTALDEESVRDLFAYLRQRRQVPMLATPLNANDFFNASDLTRWIPSSNAWKVENGEIVGRGNAKQPASLLSEMIAKDFRLTGQIKITGARAAAEIALHGAARNGRFGGQSLSVGAGGPAYVWDYGTQPPKQIPLLRGANAADWMKIEITVSGDKLRLTIGNASATEITVPAGRTVPALYIAGEGAELRVKELKLEPSP